MLMEKTNNECVDLNVFTKGTLAVLYKHRPNLQ